MWLSILTLKTPAILIQCDILELVLYLNDDADYDTKVLKVFLTTFKCFALQRLPFHIFTYLPREGNAVAGSLAGLVPTASPRPR